ncbi:hypothetical protein EX30DRAFT_351219 [Ascodesmis nigricans]|uniref:Zn(2)-C6 fungal-type domain-containing protein n=1 Tax=Ascodesmis nigricans TaxID=341454 RepID=A0A4S2MMK4_9PEZI|nr:hypothetical protein EX30DRAFT_351219 [Ascodesmis nigricans]
MATEVAVSQPPTGAVPTTPSSAASSISTPRSQQQHIPGLSRSPLLSPYRHQHPRSESPPLPPPRPRASTQHPTSLPPPGPLPPSSLPPQQLPGLYIKPPLRYRSLSSPSTPGEQTQAPGFFAVSQPPRSGPGILHSRESSGGGIRGLPPMASVLAGASQRSGAITLGESHGAFEVLAGDPTAPRKRSKVSRACDECRRKKIRCDATSESSLEQCSSCRRVGTKCSFSRVPMKRGPSKGYIKELAERLVTLENTISTGDIHHPQGGEGELSPGPSDTTSPPPGGTKRKRTLSSSSEYRGGYQLHAVPPPGPGTGHPSENRLPPIESFRTAQPHSHHEPQHPLPHLPKPPPLPRPSNSQFRISPISPECRQQEWNEYSDPGPRRRASFGTGVRPTGSSPLTDKSASLGWDEAVIDQYYTLIHPTFPLLPHSQPRLRQLLSSAPAIIRDALLEAVSAATRSVPICSPRPNTPSTDNRAVELCFGVLLDPALSSPTNQLLLLQSLILLSIEADLYDTLPSRSKRRMLLGAAAGLMQTMKLPYAGSGGQRFSVNDLDSEEMLGRRAWWVLVVLDRWQAVSMGLPLLISDDTGITLSPDDEPLLGTATYHFFQLSLHLGKIAQAFTESPPPDPSSTQLIAFTSRLLLGRLQHLHSSVSKLFPTHPLVHLTYLHCNLLIQRYNPVSAPHHPLDIALRITDLISREEGKSGAVGLLHRHFIAAVVDVLVAVGGEEAERALERVARGRWEEVVRRRRDGGGLERLVEVAVGDSAGRWEKGWRSWRDKGYFG